MTEVVDIRRGSPISDFLIDCLRGVDRMRPYAPFDVGALFEKLDITGVDAPERGGVDMVLKDELNGLGEGCEDMRWGLIGPKAGEGRGERLGENVLLLWMGSRGEDAIDDALMGLWMGCGGGKRPVDSNGPV